MSSISPFTTSKHRRPRRKTETPDVVDDVGHGWKCGHLTRDNRVCTRTVGPYFSRKLLADAIRSHLQAQHANTLPSIEEWGKADMRMARLDNGEDGYERPSG